LRELKKDVAKVEEWILSMEEEEDEEEDSIEVEDEWECEEEDGKISRDEKVIYYYPEESELFDEMDEYEEGNEDKEATSQLVHE
ncbi:hypothetical protein KI387_038142, partial [Taxus chinensis]